MGKPSTIAFEPLTPEQLDLLLITLKTRFEENMNRHTGKEWAKVQEMLEAYPVKLWSLNEMERTGGEPNVVGFDHETGEYLFVDCYQRHLRIGEILYMILRRRL